jgi:hypothetical protein
MNDTVQETYPFMVLCGNCKSTKVINIPKGKNTDAAKNNTCDYCGCGMSALRRLEGPELFLYVVPKPR